MADVAQLLWDQAAKQAGEFNSSPFSQFVNDAGTEAGGKLSMAAQDIANALMAPGRALQGGYDLMVDPATGVNYYDGMTEDAANLAGLVSLGAAPIPRPAGSLSMGASVQPNAIALRDALRQRGMSAGDINHSVNRHGEYSSYFDTPLGQIRVSDHSRNANFDTSINVMDMGDFDLASEVERLMAARVKQVAERQAIQQARNSALWDFGTRYASSGTKQARDSVLREAIESGRFGGPTRWDEWSKADRESLTRRLMQAGAGGA